MPATRSELSKLLHLAWPIMAAQLAQMGMGVVDTVMAGRYASVDLAGVALGGAVLWPCMLTMMGFLQAVTPIVAQLDGAGKHLEIGSVIRQALWIALAASVFLILLFLNAEYFYNFMRIETSASDISVPYLRLTTWGIPAMLAYFVLRFLAEGLGLTKPAMLISVCVLLLKIPLNYIFMYGLFGLEAMGGVGCGLATALLMWVQLFLIIYIVTRAKFDHVAWHEQFSWPKWIEIKALLAIGLPIGATIFFEVGMFTSVTILLGQIGTDEVAAHSIVQSISGLTYMLPLALGIAASIRIGYHIGAKAPVLARTTAKVAMLSTFSIAAMTIIFILVSRHFLMGLYTNDPIVFEMGVTLMLFVTAYQLFDNSQSTAIGALRGYKDTKVPMYFTLIGYWGFGLPLGACLGFGWISEPMGIYGFWVALILALFVVSICAVGRLYWVSNRLLSDAN